MFFETNFNSLILNVLLDSLITFFLKLIFKLQPSNLSLYILRVFVVVLLNYLVLVIIKRYQRLSRLFIHFTVTFLHVKLDLIIELLSSYLLYERFFQLLHLLIRLQHCVANLDFEIFDKKRYFLINQLSL